MKTFENILLPRSFLLFFPNSNLRFLSVNLTSTSFLSGHIDLTFNHFHCRFHCFILISSSPHEHVNSLLERIFLRILFIISNGPSLNHRWPGMGAMGPPWLSMGLLGMSWPHRWIALESQYGHVQAQIPNPMDFTTIARICCFESFATFCWKNFWVTINFWFFITQEN